MELFEKEIKSVRNCYQLSSKELEVIYVLRYGKSDKEIAEELFMSPHTVNYHLRNIFQKLDVHTRSQAIAKILKEGICFDNY